MNQFCSLNPKRECSLTWRKSGPVFRCSGYFIACGPTLISSWPRYMRKDTHMGVEAEIFTFFTWYAALIKKKKMKQVSSFLDSWLLVKYIFSLYKFPKCFRFFPHTVNTVSVPNCFNLGSSNYKNPNQRAYGTRLTSPNLFKQQIMSSASFVRSSCETEYFKGKCCTSRLENWRERVGKTVQYLL